MKKFIALLLLLSTLMASNAYASESGYFTPVGLNEWKYVESDACVTNKWIYTRDRWFYAGENGLILQNTWFNDADGKWYYFGIDGAMLHDTTTPDGYTVNSDGAWVKDGEVVVESPSATETTTNN